MITPRTQIVWFKRDLRLCDHAPLDAAVRSGNPVLPLFMIEPDYWRLPDVSRRHWHFIHDCLTGLRGELSALGADLTIRTGAAVSVLEDLRLRLGAFDLHSHEETGNASTFRRDVDVKSRECLDDRFPGKAAFHRGSNFRLELSHFACC